MPKPVCVPCQRFFRPKRNGVRVLENMPICNGAAAGLEAPDLWTPYKLWQADLWACEGCGTEIIVGFGQHHIAEHYQDDFAAAKARSGVLYPVNDC